jgi:hypothetical protein
MALDLVAMIAMLAAAARLAGAQVRPVSTVPRVVPPAAPQGLTVKLTETGVQLTWQKSADATSYRITRLQTGSPVLVVAATLPATALSYVDGLYWGGATYQVITVAADGRTAAASITYTPPPSPPPYAGPTARYIGTTLGDSILVTGSNLGGVTSVSLMNGYFICTVLNPSCHDTCTIYTWPANDCTPNPGTAAAVPFKVSASGLSFVPPANASTSLVYYLVLASPSGTSTSFPFLFRAP